MHTPQNPQNRLLFVDDEPRVRDAIRRMLRSETARWETFFAGSVEEALQIATAHPLDVVVSDVTMPVRDGLDLLIEFKRRADLAHIPVILLTGLGDSGLKRRALELGAVDLLTKPVEAADLKARLENVLKIKDYEDRLRRHADELEARVEERTRDLERSRIEILMRLAMAGEHRDTDTGRHVVRVAQVSRVIAEQLGLDEHECEKILVTSALHDLGKVGIPDRILRKAGPLTPQEREEMQHHCEIGDAILRSRGVMGAAVAHVVVANSGTNDLLEMAGRIALNHHERWDGTGYPDGLRGPAIPIEARIVAGADVFDALCSERPYKAAVPPKEVRRIMAKESGRHFDPAVWAAMDARWDDLVNILHSLTDTPALRHRAAA